MTEPTSWLTIPDIVEALGVTPGKIHRLLEDHHLLAVRVDGVLQMPADFIKDGEPLPELRGTLVLLADSGYTDDESMQWLLASEESLGTSPLAALRAGRKSEVRRVAQALAF
ncbi:Rv2175c family DNA-binding protein [Homoserinibacter sp. GY 40078]|uniref:Rv2175c family DNA-binding protein n=1 Tax=Homoserinibacter sp. GY 40078 TaxID=2603275 RepID=UPI0011CA8BED|nr:Rv2175c family DNA-binding protein [Homoserinibacter sp. GY 40078]TXK17697.1 DNA-binding protein [Homoserinibacter sp. GY 40078]